MDPEKINKSSTFYKKRSTKQRVPCLVCCKTFSSKSSLSHHKKRCKGGPYTEQLYIKDIQHPTCQIEDNNKSNTVDDCN